MTGVAGQALQLDGIAAHVLVPAAEVPRLAGSFTVEGWVALGAYPFNDAPLLQQADESGGWFLGVGDRGQFRFDVAAGDHTLSVVSSSRLALCRDAKEKRCKGLHASSCRNWNPIGISFRKPTARRGPNLGITRFVKASSGRWVTWLGWSRKERVCGELVAAVFVTGAFSRTEPQLEERR